MTPPETEHPAQYPLRQQLSSDSKELLERAAHAEVARLAELRSNLFALQAGARAIDRVDVLIAAARRAINELAYVYADQFAAGRAENDRAGHTGLTPTAEKAPGA